MSAVTKTQEAAQAAQANVAALESERADLAGALESVQAEVETVLDEQAAVRLVARERVIVNQLKALNQKLIEAKAAHTTAQQAADQELWKRLEVEFTDGLTQFATQCMNLRAESQRLYHLDDQRSSARARATSSFHAGGDSDLLALGVAVESWMWKRGQIDVTTGPAGRVVTLKKGKV